MNSQTDPAASLRLLRRQTVSAYAEALAEYRQIEPELALIRGHHRSRKPLTAAQRELVGSLRARGLRHGITLTRAAAALDLLERDPEPAGGDADEIAEELILMRRAVRVLADLYVLMIAVASAEDLSGLPYADPDLLPEYA